MSNQQKELRLHIQRLDNPDQATDLRTNRNQLLHNIKQNLKENIETETERRVSEVKNTEENSKIFKAVNMLNQIESKQPYSSRYRRKTIAEYSRHL